MTRWVSESHGSAQSFLLAESPDCLTAAILEFGPSWIIYPLVVHGKPVNLATVPAFFPIMFELTVLFSAFAAFFAVLIMNGLPRWYHPIFNWERFSRATNDGFFLVIEARDPRFTENGGARAFRAKRRPTHHHDSRGVDMLRGFFLIFFLTGIAMVAVLRVSRTEEHGFADRSFSGHGAPTMKVRAQAPLAFFCRRPRRRVRRSPARFRSATKCRNRRRSRRRRPTWSRERTSTASGIQRRNRLLQHRQDGERTGGRVFRSTVNARADGAGATAFQH